MSGDCFSPIDICGIQLNRLDCTGALLGGATDVVVMCEGVDIAVTPKLIPSVTDVTRNGGGGVCAQRTTKARVEGYDVVWNICPKIDAEAWELLNLFDAVLDTAGVTGGTVGDTVGIRDGAAGNPCNCNTTPCLNPGVAMLLWANNTDANGISTSKPYSILALTKVVFDPPAVAIKNVYQNITITGRTQPNTLYDRGPGNIYPELVGLSSAFALSDSSQVPPGGCQCDLCGFASGEDTPYPIPPCPIPEVLVLSLTTGSNGGGDTVNITGTGFTNATAVLFGVTPAAAFVVNSSISITATTPAHADGIVDVFVVNACAQSSLANPPADQFTFTGV